MTKPDMIQSAQNNQPASSSEITAVSPSTRPLGFLGAGLMATPMIERLLAAGRKVMIWNRTRSKILPLLALGAVEADSPADLAQNCELVFMCVMDAAAVEHSVFGDLGLCAASPGRLNILVDHSSIRPDATRQFAERLKALSGATWIDAPVSGGAIGARLGNLAIMAGGPADAIAAVEPHLRCYAGQVTRMGETGAGQTTKLINQILVCSVMTTVAESVALAEAAGINAALLPQALAGGWADSKPLQVLVPRMLSGYDAPMGALSTLLKDIDTALELARQVNCALPMAASAQQLLRLMSARGLGDSDPAEIASLYRKPGLNQG